MLKIAVVTRYFPSSAEPWQGRSAYQTLRVLAREADVRVFFPNARYPSFLKPRSRVYDRLDPSYNPPDVDVSYYNYAALPLVSRPFNGWMAARCLLPHVRSFAPDLIFSIFLYPDGYAALKIGKALSVPVVAMGIGSDIHSIGDRVSARHTRTVLRGVDFLVTVSDDLRKQAVAMGAAPAKTRAIVNGCDLSVFRVRDRHEARQKLHMDPASEAIVYIGRMDVKKGLRELVEAAAALHPQRPRLHVYLVGEGPDRSLIERAIQSTNATSYIHAMPACAFDDVAVWMAAADLVTLPSYMEGCPNVVLEALACGRPVVATHVGGIPEIMNDECGRLVPPRDSVELAQALSFVLDTTWDASAISASRGRSWTAVAAELMDVFHSVLSDSQAAAHDQ
jgi:glycosyltransferase involved in cell wall biosynthesis